MSRTNNNNEITWWSVIAALGYLGVVIVCYIVGSSIKLDKLSFGLIYSDSFGKIFFALVAFYYAHRTIFIDFKENDDKEIKSQNLLFGGVVFVAIVVLAYSIYNISIVENIQYVRLVPILLAIIPFGYLFFSEKKWRSDNINDKSNYHFSNYIFFPSLFTCIIPFFLGYCMGQNEITSDSIFQLAFVSGLLILYHFFHIKFYQSITVHKVAAWIFVVLLLSVSYLSYSTIGSGTNFLLTLQYLIVVSIMALLMGIAESWYFIEDQKTLNVLPVDVEHSEYKNSISNATLIIPFLMILGFLYPIVNDDYSIVFLFSALLTIIWFIYLRFEHKVLKKARNRDRFWKALRLLLGFSIPIIIYHAINNELIINLSFVDNIRVDFIIQSSVLFAFGMASLFSLFGIRFNNYDQFTKALIFGSISLLFAVLIFEGFFSIKDDVFEHKLSIVKLIYLGIFLISFCFILYKQMRIELFRFDGAVNQFNPLKAKESQVVSNEASPKGESAQNQNEEKNGEGFDEISFEVSKKYLFNGSLLNLLSRSSFDFGKFKSAIIDVGRPIPSFLAFLLSFTFFYVEGNFVFLNSILFSLPIYFLTSIGFLYNDLFDFEKDKERYQDKALINGRTDGYHVLIVFVLYLLGLISLSFYINGYNEFLCLLMIFISVHYYSPFSHKRPLFKGLYTALLTLSPLVYAGIASGLDINYFLLCCIIIFITAREAILDVFDFEFDRKFGIITIPQLIGKKLCLILSICLMFLGSTLLILQIQFSIYLCLLGLILFTLLARSSWNAIQLDEKNFSRNTQISMLIAIVIFFL